MSFQSTCPARGTTVDGDGRRTQRAYFNPRAPRGARHPLHRAGGRIRAFQSTCPARGTTVSFAGFVSREKFQSTCPARGTTVHTSLRWPPSALFQSTCPARGTTAWRTIMTLPELISIHVPREGHDSSSGELLPAPQDFNPRAPRGARQWADRHTGRRLYFNPRAPRGARQQTCTIFSCRFAQELQISR